MAEPYFERLSQIIGRLGLTLPKSVVLEIKHFFSGAALYANGKICASLGPVGFAVKLPEESRTSLIDDGNGKEFRFFEKGPIKREYAVLSDAIIQDEKVLRRLIEISAQYAVGKPR